MRRGAGARGGAGSGRRCAFGRLPVMNTDVTVQQDCAARRAPEPPLIVSPSQGGANRSGKRVQSESHAPWRVPGAPARAAARGRGRSARAQRPPPTRPARRRSTRAPRAAPRCEARTPFRARPPVCGLWKPPQAAARARKTPLYVSPKGEAAVVRRAHASARVTPPASVTVRLTRLHVMPTASRISQGVDTRTAETHGCCAALIIFLRLR